MVDATMDVKTQAPEDAARSVRVEVREPDGAPNWTMSYEKLSGFLQS
ncbi:hypothetical protein [Roseomonas marmotae]|uniref:Uncharacterized protein n=1 Tax=Roseomonas marmotae TaxID=2768161 RepID=A0ABS3KHY5_9PROT|nr:hypothetical protein [Roseomonas marmotae]MBO1077079.1 hypothetical protein [Roseomonas marmotae]QTI82166.1 hypothetical protein IAI58_22720 [Roseomonas marmotae]